MWPRLISYLVLLVNVFSQTPDWSSILAYSSAPSTLESPPQGCSCADSSSPCTRYDCACTCNLHSRMCDANCCCDPDCTSSEIASYKNTASCLPEGPPNKTVTKCINPNGNFGLLYINPKTRCVGGNFHSTPPFIF